MKEKFDFKKENEKAPMRTKPHKGLFRGDVLYITE